MTVRIYSKIIESCADCPNCRLGGEFDRYSCRRTGKGITRYVKAAGNKFPQFCPLDEAVSCPDGDNGLVCDYGYIKEQCALDCLEECPFRKQEK